MQDSKDKSTIDIFEDGLFDMIDKLNNRDDKIIQMIVDGNYQSAYESLKLIVDDPKNIEV